MNSTTIARNSFWTGVEFVLDFVAGTGTSIAIAWALGPAQLGYYIYISWIANMSMVLGNVGVPGAAVKYMAEYLGAPGQQGVARLIYGAALRIQALMAVTIAVAGIILVIWFGNPEYRTASILLMLTIVPGMINTMPSNANLAAENPRANLPGSICSTLLYTAGITVSLIFGWRFTGIAASFLIGRTVECLVRLTGANRWINRLPAAAWPADMRRKLLTFSGHNLVLMVLGVVVWDRSEIFFLKNFYPDVRHVAYYSLAFSTAENVLKLIRIFSASAAMTIRAQYGRDKRHLPNVLALTAKYVALLAFPMYLGLAVVGPAGLRLAYGPAYASACPVLMVAAILAIPKAFLVPVQVFLQSVEQQGFLVRWSVIGGVFNIALDWVLIRQYGAIGAAYGNGVAQLFVVAALWVGTAKMFGIQLPYRSMGQFLLASLAMAAGLLPLIWRLRPVTALAIGIPAGTLFFFLALRLLGGLDHADRRRMAMTGARLPFWARNAFTKALNLATAPLAKEPTAS